MAKSYTFEALGLLHGDPDMSFLNIVNMASRVFDAPLSFVSVIEDKNDRQHVAAADGPLAGMLDPAGVPLDSSICTYVQAAQKTLAIPDLLLDPRTQHMKVVREAGLRAYLGSPIHALTGKVIGAVCCMTTSPRSWTDNDILTLENMASCVDEIIKARAIAMQERQLALRQQTRDGHRGAYMAHIGHEIRTPLTGIIASIRMLDRPQSPEQTERLKRILNSSADRLQSFVRDALDLSKLDTAEAQIVEDDVCVSDLVNDIAQTYRDDVAAKGLRFTIEDALREKSYRLDRHGLATVLHSLIENAVRFTESGGITIRLSEDSYGQVVIEICDTGKGVAAGHHGNFFEEFELAPDSAARTYGGTGLGMAIVKRIVERMDGTIRLGSHAGQGSLFTISLPLQPV